MVSDSYEYRLKVLQDAPKRTLGNLAHSGLNSLSQFNQGQIIVLVCSDKNVDLVSGNDLRRVSLRYDHSIGGVDHLPLE